MHTRRLTLPLLALMLGIAQTLLADAKPTQKTKGPVPKGNCAVCGMYVANFPDWASMVSYKDGTQAWFDGPKDLFHYLLDLKQYAPKHSAADITSIQVKDYYGLKHIDARKGFFVLGSDVMGPMGKELVPFATEASAKDFMKDHRGQKVLNFPEITQEVLKGME